MKIRNIAIIGAGPAGIVAAKECLEAGLNPTLFEAHGDLGGVWQPEHGKSWHNMGSLLSRFHMGFSDFPFHSPQDFPSALEVYEYLHRYADKHHVAQRIMYNARVTSFDYSQPHWHVKVQQNGKTATQQFDGLVLAHGVFAKPFMPDLPMADFNGGISHSATYKNACDFQDKQVTVIGGSYSGYEIASDLARQGVQVKHVFRTPSWIAGRYTNDVPFDLVSYRYAPPVDKMTAQENRLKKLAYLQQRYGNPGDAHADLSMDAHNTDPANIVIAEDYLYHVTKGTITPHKDALHGAADHLLHLASGKRIPSDHLLFCTGYHSAMPRFPLLEQQTRYQQNDMFQPYVLNKSTLHPAFPSLGFVGLYRGPYFGAMEMQARWIASVFSGTTTAPTAQQHLLALQFEQNLRDIKTPRPPFPRPDYVGFMLEMANEIGVAPHNLIGTDRPMIPADFRLYGQGAKPVLAWQQRDMMQQRLSGI